MLAFWSNSVFWVVGCCCSCICNFIVYLWLRHSFCIQVWVFPAISSIIMVLVVPIWASRRERWFIYCIGSRCHEDVFVVVKWINFEWLLAWCYWVHNFWDIVLDCLKFMGIFCQWVFWINWSKLFRCVSIWFYRRIWKLGIIILWLNLAFLFIWSYDWRIGCIFSTLLSRKVGTISYCSSIWTFLTHWIFYHILLCFLHAVL